MRSHPTTPANVDTMARATLRELRERCDDAYARGGAGPDARGKVEDAVHSVEVRKSYRVLRETAGLAGATTVPRTRAAVVMLLGDLEWARLNPDAGARMRERERRAADRRAALPSQLALERVTSAHAQVMEHDEVGDLVGHLPALEAAAQQLELVARSLPRRRRARGTS